MKTLLLGLLVIGSISCFAQDSEFERGYEAGKDSCNAAKESWYCTLPEGIKKSVSYEGCYYDNETAGIGKTRSEAVLRMSKECLARITQAGKKPSCTSL